ncbi:MAG TPA: ATPase domain-containing protein [Pseudolabrys sp.]|jgi:circadian clock protein KaiC|nr:ATPase domain-containing protein [Pseudolabrys sp.]
MTKDKQTDLERVPTGIAGLDRILRGGFLKGGVYIVQGTPGAGKTILANQVCFRHVAAGGHAVFITLLSESHARMLQHLRPMSFYDEAAIPSSIYYVSGFNILETDGLKGIVDLIRREIKGHRASLLVLDGFSVTEESASSEREFKKFVQEIQSHTAASECTALLLTNGSNRAVTPEYTMVDGLIDLDNSLYGERSERGLLVRKFRGSGFLPGRHAFRITDDGIVVYPRIEAVFAKPSRRDEYRLRRISTGIRGLDEMIGGGLPAETTNGLFGPTGSGKTTSGLQFVGLSTAAEPGLFFGAFESPERLRVKAASIGIDLAGMERRGEVEIIWRPQGEHIMDDLGHQIIDAVRRRSIKRLVVDGLGGLMEAAVHRERISRYISALANELRALNATVLMTMEDRQILGASMRLPIDGMSSLLEGLMLLRYAEVEGRVQRLLSITKIRDSDFDPFLHEMKITNRGIEVGGRLSGAEAILSGYAREPKAVPTGQLPQKRHRPEE